MKRTAMVPMIVIALTTVGCGGSETSAPKGGEAAASGAEGRREGAPMSSADVAAEAANAPRLRAGQYAVSVEIARFEIPGMPEQQAAMMRQVMAGVGQQVQQQCVTEAQANANMEDAYKRLGNGNCAMQRFSVEGGRVNGEMTCTAGQTQTAMRIDGTISDENSTTTVSSTISDPQLPQGRAEMEMRVNMRRTGDCAG